MKKISKIIPNDLFSNKRTGISFISDPSLWVHLNSIAPFFYSEKEKRRYNIKLSLIFWMGKNYRCAVTTLCKAFE